ncbi:MAG: sulfate ABC transporter substrate-binding protein, partial [Armatimonadetes bacterium]|nr:sulfate ABC transporter substrate-binding protein [Armatimonadota bacterium]
MALLCMLLAGCRPENPTAIGAADLPNAASPGDGPQRSLTLAASSVTKEAFQKEVIPAFQRYWKAKTG